MLILWLNNDHHTGHYACVLCGVMTAVLQMCLFIQQFPNMTYMLYNTVINDQKDTAMFPFCYL